MHTLNSIHSVLLRPDKHWPVHASHSRNPDFPSNHVCSYSVLTVDCSTHATMDARNKFVATDRLLSTDTSRKGWN